MNHDQDNVYARLPMLPCSQTESIVSKAQQGGGIVLAIEEHMLRNAIIAYRAGLEAMGQGLDEDVVLAPIDDYNITSAGDMAIMPLPVSNAMVNEFLNNTRYFAGSSLKLRLLALLRAVYFAGHRNGVAQVCATANMRPDYAENVDKGRRERLYTKVLPAILDMTGAPPLNPDHGQQWTNGSPVELHGIPPGGRASWDENNYKWKAI